MATTGQEGALLELVGDVIGLLELDEFHRGLLRALRAAVPVEWASLNDLAPDPADTVAIAEPEFPEEAHEVFRRHAFDNPLAARVQRTGDGRAYRFSDVCTPEELHATALYREFYAKIGLEYQIAFTLPHSAGRLLAIALSRRDRDFTDAERDLLDAARPFLIQCYRNALTHGRVQAELAQRSHGAPLPLEDRALKGWLAERGITARQAEALSLVATGRSDRAVAEALGVSERTVQKHLQVCFARLGVHSRAEAVELAWSRVGSPLPGLMRPADA